MSHRELQIARAAVDAAATICNRQHHRMDLPGDYRYAAGICESHIREIDLPSIVAGVGEDAEGAALRAKVAELTDKALRFDLDQAGIEAREREAVELVELRARVAELEQDRDAWMLLAKAKPLPMDECPVHCETGRKLSARVAELETEVARARTVEDMWRAEALKAQQMLVEERARVAELETKLTEEAAAWESAARIDAAMEVKK